MLLRKRYIFLALFLFCVLAMSGFFVLRYFTADEKGASGSRVTFEWLIEPQLHMANDFYEGRAWVQEKENGPWKLIDKSGRTIVENFQAERIAFYSQDTGLAMFTNMRQLKGYVNLSGDIVISPGYSWAWFFRDGLASVAKKIDKEPRSRYGIIDRNGKIVIPIIYEFIDVIHSCFFAAKKDGKWGYINEKGDVIVDYIFEAPNQSVFPPNVCMAVLNGKAGLLDEKGQWILPASYDKVYQGGEVLIALAKKGKVGFVDAKGNTVIDFQFLEVPRHEVNSYTFSEGLAVIALSTSQIKLGENGPTVDVIDKSAVIDKTGKVLFRFPGRARSQYKNGFLLVGLPDETYGLVDRSGNWHPLPSYLGIDGFEQNGLSERVLRVKTKGENSGPYEKNKYGYLRINY